MKWATAPWLAMLASASAWGAAPYDSPMTIHSARYIESTIYIESRGTLYNNTTDRQSGTGFFITPDGYAITVAHVIPSPDVYKSVEVWGYVGTKRPENRVSLQVIDVDWKRDVALLRADFPPGRRAIPVARPHNLIIGSWVGILSFEGEDEVAGNQGFIRSLGDRKGFWKCSFGINPGSSGAPIFDSHGRIVAIAWGSERFVIKVIDGVERMVPLQDINYVLPYDSSVSDLLLKNRVLHPAAPEPNKVEEPTRALATDPAWRERSKETSALALFSLPTRTKSLARLRDPDFKLQPGRASSGSTLRDYRIDIRDIAESSSVEFSKIFHPRDGYRIENMTATVVPNTEAQPVTLESKSARYLPDGSAEFRMTLNCHDCSDSLVGAIRQTKVPFDYAANISFVEAPVRQSANAPEHLNQVFDISHVPVDRPLLWDKYERRLAAEPGYRITEAKFQQSAASKVRSVGVIVSKDGKEAVATYVLPRDGWIFGSVRTRQVRISSP